ncbi:MAG: hypothetical protein MUF58_17255 [Arcicella sp.]|nr:hypothetical protein [Arcicella sp.]
MKRPSQKTLTSKEMIATVARGVLTMRRNLIPLKITKYHNQMKNLIINH